jgi:hypothetical protein
VIQTRLLFDILAEHNISLEDVRQRFGVEKMAELYEMWPDNINGEKLPPVLSILDDDETIVKKLSRDGI